MVAYVYVHMGVGRGSGWLVRAVERVSGGQRVALTGKGGCCPPILIWNNILACNFSLSFQKLQDKEKRVQLQWNSTRGW
jgi:hypothetical protein